MRTPILMVLLPTLIMSTGCGEGGTEPDATGEGTLRIGINQSGLQLDREVGALVDGEIPVNPPGPYRFGGGFAQLNLPAGTHEISLTGLEANCWVVRPILTVNIEAGGNASARFNVICNGEELIGNRKAAVVFGTYSSVWGNSFIDRVGSMDASGKIFTLHSNASTITLAPDGNRFAVTSYAGVELVEGTGSRSLATTNLIEPLAWAPRRDAVAGLALEIASCQLHLWEGPAWTPARIVYCGPGLADTPFYDVGPPFAGDLSWSPDERSIAVVTASGDLTLVSLDTGELTPVSSIGRGYRLSGVAWSPSGREIAVTGECHTCSTNSIALVIDVNSLTVIRTFEWQGEPLPLAWTSDGTQLILGTLWEEYAFDSCSVIRVVPLDQPDEWRPLAACGSNGLVRVEIRPTSIDD